MKRTGRNALRPRVTTLLAASVLGFTAVLAQVGGVAADASNVENIQQQIQQTVGQATGPGGLSGPAIALDEAIVNQVNVQVIAGDEATVANSTQTATNEVNIDQTTSASSGDTDATGGGTAGSGVATAMTLAMVTQVNVQVIAGFGCSVTQEASNVANTGQSTTADSGDATSSDEGSATTGNANAENLQSVYQRNVQVYFCRDVATGSQIANNMGDFDSTVAAASGDADASGGSAASGDANSTGEETHTQENRQFAFN